MFISIRLLRILFLSLLMDIILFKIKNLLLKLLGVNKVSFFRITTTGVHIKSFINFFSTILATSSNIFSNTLYKIFKYEIIDSVLGIPTFQLLCAITIIFDISYIIYVIYNILYVRAIQSYKSDINKVKMLKSKGLKKYFTRNDLGNICNLRPIKVIWVIHRMIKENLLEYNKNAVVEKRYKIR